MMGEGTLLSNISDQFNHSFSERRSSPAFVHRPDASRYRIRSPSSKTTVATPLSTYSIIIVPCVPCKLMNPGNGAGESVAIVVATC